MNQRLLSMLCCLLLCAMARPLAAAPAPLVPAALLAPEARGVAAPSTGPLTARPTDPPPALPAPAFVAPGFFLEVQPPETTLGEPVTIILRATGKNLTNDAIAGVTFKPDEDEWQVDTPWRRDWAPKQGETPGTWSAVVRPFVTGELTIPATTLLYNSAASADAAGTRTEVTLTTGTLTVRSVLPADEKAAFVGLRAPTEIEHDWTWLWWLGAAVALLGTAVVLAWRRWRRGGRPAAPVEPPLPPGLWALRELDRRSRLPVCAAGPPKLIFSHVSEVVRLYIERRFGVSAIDMTTLECLHALHALGLSEELLRWIRDFLDECDLVKFTRIEPSRERWRTIWNDARLIVQMSTPPDELAAAAAGPVRQTLPGGGELVVPGAPHAKAAPAASTDKEGA